VTTLVDEIARAAAEHADVALVFASVSRPVSTTVGELFTNARRAAGALQALGVGPGSVVAVQVPNWYEGAVAQAAAVLTGATLLPIVQIYGPRELGFILRESRAATLVVPDKFRGRDHEAIVAAAGPLPALRTLVVIGHPSTEGALPWTELAAGTGAGHTPPGLEPADRALLVYTSGTTADPKGVQHSHASLLGELANPLLEPVVRADSVQLAVFPGGHVAGLLGLLRMLTTGMPTVVMDVWDPARAAALIDEFGVTSSVGAPVHLAALLDEQRRGSATLASLREYMVGAAGVPPALVEQADGAGIATYRCYGSSEHPTISSGRADDPLVKRALTDGRPTPGTEVRLVDDDGADVATGVDGEIITRGPELFSGYTDPALNADAFLSGGWFRTGDIGRLDDDGYLTITDRKKDIIVRGGENISSQEIEDLLIRHPSVAEAAAIGAPDERYGERVCAVVVLRPAATLDLAELAAHFATEGSARQKTPERLMIIDEFPRTAAGKIQKHLLRARLSD
jgi:cyclohexanecarboxylate-CoA ligase